MPEARSVITQPDFSKIFASAAAVGELLNWPSEDYLRGWGYLQPQEAPPMEYFNAFYNGTDTKLLYLFSAANIRKSSTAYQIDDIVTSPNLSSKYWLVCTQAGTTDANEPDYSEVDANEEITDGTAKFLVTLRVSQGIAVGETAPDNPREGDLWLQTSSTKKTAELKQRTSSGWAKVLIETILNAVTDSPIKTLERNAACNVNTVYAETTLPKGGFLICTQAGTTGASSATGFATAEESSVITDGTAKFEVHYFDQIVSKINIFTGATSNLAGKAGLVPAPAVGDNVKFLTGAGCYQPVATQEQAEAGTDDLAPMTALKVKQAIAAQVQGIPVGDVVYRPFLMQGYVKANGATVNRADYPNLVAYANEHSLWTSSPSTEPWKYGNGDGSTTMVLPDYRNRVIQGGDTTAILQAGLPNIAGTFAFSWLNSNNGPLFRSSTQNAYTFWSQLAEAYCLGFNASRANTIYGAAETVQPPAIVLIAQIKF